MRAQAKEIRGFAPETEARLAAYRWPGNIDELAEEIERIVILTPAGEWAGPEVLSDRVRGGTV